MTQSLPWLAALFLPLALIAAIPDDQLKRAHTLEDKLLAPCCYQEPVSRHQSEIAVKMRAEIARLVSTGKSDDEIIRVYTARYGQKVVADFAPTPGWAPWVPWGLALLAAVGLACWLPRLVRRPAPTES